MKGLVVQLLNHLSEYDCPQEDVSSIGARMNLSQMTILSEKSLYKRRKTKADFTEQLKDEEESEELSMEEVLNLNKVRNRYSQKEIEAFIEGSMTDGKMVVEICEAYTITGSGSGHFIVLTGVTKDGYITIADCASRERTGKVYSVETIASYGRDLADGAFWIIWK